MKARSRNGEVVYHRIWMIGRGEARGTRKVAEARCFLVVVPEEYPNQIPLAYPLGWKATKENTWHHTYPEDGTICYGRALKNPSLASEIIRLINVIKFLDDYVAGMVEYRLTGRWTNGEGLKE